MRCIARNIGLLYIANTMLDFSLVRTRQKTLVELVAGLGIDDLRALTNESLDKIESMIADSTDADVVFTPVDPKANDTFASSEGDKDIAWNLGHLIVHVTASSEESAFLGTEMARGVANHGRSRYETPWETVQTIAQCRARLAESRRMRLSLLDAWPDQPNTEVLYEPYANAGARNCYAQFVGGLSHEQDHWAQIQDVVNQAKAGRSA